MNDKDIPPKCCHQCEHLYDYERGAYGELLEYGYCCSIGLMFPTCKKSCKKQTIGEPIIA